MEDEARASVCVCVQMAEEKCRLERGQPLSNVKLYAVKDKRNTPRIEIITDVNINRR